MENDGYISNLRKGEARNFTYHQAHEKRAFRNEQAEQESQTKKPVPHQPTPSSRGGNKNTSSSIKPLSGDDPELVDELKRLEQIDLKTIKYDPRKELLMGKWSLVWSGVWPSTAVTITLHPDGKLYQDIGNYSGKWETIGQVILLDYDCYGIFQAEINSDQNCFRGLRTAGYSPYAMYVARKL